MDAMEKGSCWPEHLDCEYREYIGRNCFLNGQPAKVCKNKDGYARVCPLDPELGSVPYSWCAVWNIMDNHDGKFGNVT